MFASFRLVKLILKPYGRGQPHFGRWCAWLILLVNRIKDDGVRNFDITDNGVRRMGGGYIVLYYGR